ncbi:MAG: hypothetical protein ACTHYM_06040 [Actinomycetaceae bacterium]
MPTPASAHARRIVDLVPADLSAGGRVGPFVLGIDGRSGAGKSTLASDVVDHLSTSRVSADRIALVRLDAHYPGWSGLLDGVDAVRSMLAALREGHTGSAPTWDWHRGAPGRVRHVPAADEPFPLVVVAEGCGTTLLHKHLDALAWVDAPEDLRAGRAAARDGDISSWWDVWSAQEQQAMDLADPARLSDLRLRVTE